MAKEHQFGALRYGSERCVYCTGNRLDRIHAVTVTEKPTVDNVTGLYRVVDEQGLYWGTWNVTANWLGEKFVMEWLY